MNLQINKKIKLAAACVIFGIAAVVYYIYDPSLPQNPFPPCPTSYLWGLECPGCGSQRAFHALLHFDIPRAFSYNPVMIVALPYVLLGIYFEYFGGKQKYPNMRRRLFGKTATIVTFIVVIVYFILRNVDLTSFS